MGVPMLEVDDVLAAPRAAEFHQRAVRLQPRPRRFQLIVRDVEREVVIRIGRVFARIGFRELDGCLARGHAQRLFLPFDRHAQRIAVERRHQIEAGRCTKR